MPNINRRETLNIQYVTFRDAKYNVGWTCLMAEGYRIKLLVIQTGVTREIATGKKSENAGDLYFCQSRIKYGTNKYHYYHHNHY